MSRFVTRVIEPFRRWLFRLYGPESAPIVLVQRRIFVLPTGAGAVFGMTLILLLIGSINYFLSLGFMLTFLLAGLGIVSIVHAFRNLVGLEIAPGRCEPVFAGDDASFGLLVRNRRPDARWALALRPAQGVAALIDVPGDATAEARLALPTRERGWRRLDRVTLDTTYPLGLIRGWSYVQPDMRCLAYPKPESAAPPLPLGLDGREGAFQSAFGMDDFAGLRGHQPADPPRHIAWKAVAREAPLLTKQFSGTAAGSVWLDWAALPPQLDTEARLSRLTAWVIAAHAACVPFGLRLPGCELKPAADEAHVRRCLQELALHGKN